MKTLLWGNPGGTMPHKDVSHCPETTAASLKKTSASLQSLSLVGSVVLIIPNTQCQVMDSFWSEAAHLDVYVY